MKGRLILSREEITEILSKKFHIKLEWEKSKGPPHKEYFKIKKGRNLKSS